MILECICLNNFQSNETLDETNKYILYNLPIHSEMSVHKYDYWFYEHAGIKPTSTMLV